MPPLPAARREQAPAPPAQRNQWWCRERGCHATGYGQNATAARVAAQDHWDRTHKEVPAP